MTDEEREVIKWAIAWTGTMGDHHKDYPSPNRMASDMLQDAVFNLAKKRHKTVEELYPEEFAGYIISWRECIAEHPEWMEKLIVDLPWMTISERGAANDKEVLRKVRMYLDKRDERTMKG